MLIFSPMKKKMDLKTFSVYHYLKERHSHSMNVPYFLADHNTYKHASIRFPFRTFTYGIGLTYSGKGGMFRIGSTDYQVQTGSLTTMGPGIVSQWMGDYSSAHYTLYFTDELFKDTLKPSFLKSLSFFLPGGTHMITLPDDDVRKMKSIFELLSQFSNEPKVVPGFIYSLLMLTIRCHDAQHKIRSTSAISIKEKIASDFRSLLSKKFLEKKDVAFYAGQLNITPKYLSEVLLAETGKSAKSLIDEHIFLEAKSLLRQTSMSVQEICHWLGYTDTSYFNKAFKKHEGMTPLAYRKL